MRIWEYLRFITFCHHTDCNQANTRRILSQQVKIQCRLPISMWFQTPPRAFWSMRNRIVIAGVCWENLWGIFIATKVSQTATNYPELPAWVAEWCQRPPLLLLPLSLSSLLMRCRVIYNLSLLYLSTILNLNKIRSLHNHPHNQWTIIAQSSQLTDVQRYCRFEKVWQTHRHIHRSGYRVAPQLKLRI